MTTRRIEVTMTIDVDEEAWCLEYGTTPEELAGDVEEHVTNTAVQHLSSLGLLA